MVIISATAKVSDLKFGVRLGFAKSHHKDTTKEKVGVGQSWWAPKFVGFPFIISAMSETIDFKFGVQLGFAQAFHENTTKKVNVALGWGALEYLGFP